MKITPSLQHSSAGVTVKSVHPRIWSGGTDNVCRFGPGRQIMLADLVHLRRFGPGSYANFFQQM